MAFDGTMASLVSIDKIINNCIVNGFKEAVSHDSKMVENITAYIIGITSLLFFAAFINELTNAHPYAARPKKPVFNHNVK